MSDAWWTKVTGGQLAQGDLLAGAAADAAETLRHLLTCDRELSSKGVPRARLNEVRRSFGSPQFF